MKGNDSPFPRIGTLGTLVLGTVRVVDHTMDIDRLLADLARWAGDQQADAAARSRSDEAWLRRQAEEEARFTGLAVDLAEQGTPVTVRTTAGRQHHGIVVAVADDFLVVRATGERPVFLPYRSIAVVRPSMAAGSGSPRRAPLGARLVHALSGMAADRPRVIVVVDGGETVTGELQSVGVDVFALRLDGTPPSIVHGRVDAVNEVTLLG
jgi:small nuclear ribonucleoprotein (snRNP)-like protein